VGKESGLIDAALGETVVTDLGAPSSTWLGRLTWSKMRQTLNRTGTNDDDVRSEEFLRLLRG